MDKLKLFEEILNKENQWDPSQPINTVEECENALWYVENQLHKMTSLIKKIIDNEVTINFSITNKLQESDIRAGLELYEQASKEIRICKSNVDTATASIGNFLRNNKELSPDSQIFESIEQWTGSVESYAKRYNKMFVNSKGLLPNIDNVCLDYSYSIDLLNTALVNTNIEVRQPVFN